MEFQLPPEKDDVASPCARICTLDPGRELCIGCGRTRAEIADWTRLSVDEKRRVLAVAEARRANFT